MNEKQILCEKIISLLENYKIYLSPTMNLSDFAKILKVKEPYLKQYFNEDIKYSFEQTLNVFRITHATDLLMKECIPYEELWKGSGFKSHEDFENAFKLFPIPQKPTSMLVR